MNALHRIFLGLAVTLAWSARLSAGEPPRDRATVEELYAGELADTGPQYLLVPGAAREPRITAWTRADVSWTNNATFTEAGPRGSSITSWQAGLDARLRPRELAGGRLAVGVGLRGQIFRYGLLGGDDKVIDFLQIDRNNFDLVGAHVRAAWQRGAWLATSSLQGTLLRNRSAGRTFYREFLWDAGLFRQWALPRGSTLLLGGELARRWTWTDTYGLLPTGWNDRAEAALTAAWSQPLRHGLVWRTTARALGTEYTHTGRHRRDLTGTLGTELAWTWRERLELRVFLNHERRDSTEAAMPDYARWEGGLGAGLRWEF